MRTREELERLIADATQSFTNMLRATVYKDSELFNLSRRNVVLYGDTVGLLIDIKTPMER